MTQAKERIKVETRYLTITADTFTSHLELMDGVRFLETVDEAVFFSDIERSTIAAIKELFGAANFTEPGILFGNFKSGRLFTPKLKAYPDGVLGVKFGDNMIPLLIKEGTKGEALFLGEASVEVQETTVKYQDEVGNDVTKPVVNLVCERLFSPIDRVRMVLQTAIKEGEDPTEVADYLKSCDLEGVYSLIDSPKGGGGGLFVDAKLLAKAFNISKAKVLPIMSLPITGYELKEFMWEDKPIRSVNLNVAPEHLPEIMLIKWKNPSTKAKQFYKLTREQCSGLQFGSASNAYRFFKSKDEADIAQAIASGTLFLNVFSYAENNKEHTPNHNVAIMATGTPKVDYSLLDYSVIGEYMDLPGKDTPAEDVPTETEQPTTPRTKATKTVAALVESTEDIEV